MVIIGGTDKSKREEQERWMAPEAYKAFLTPKIINLEQGRKALEKGALEEEQSRVRLIKSIGLPIDFLLSAKRDASAAERFLAEALGRENQPAPRVINTDEHAGYPPAIGQLKAEEARPVQYLNNVLEQVIG